MAVAYYYSSVAGEYTLAGAVNASVASIALDGVVGLPSPPFKLVINPGDTTEEIVKVTSVAGTNLTVVRGHDGTSAVSHDALVKVRHMMTAEDLRLSREHEDATTNVHGVSGTLAGTTDLNAHTSSTTAHGATGANVGTTNVQTLTNKTLSGASNTFSDIPQASVTGLPTLKTDVDTLKTDVNALKADVSSTTGVATAATGWSITVQEVRKKGDLCSVYLRGSRTGSTIPGNTSGDIVNVEVASLTAEYWPAVPASGTTVADGQGAFFSIWTDGGVALTALGPGTTFNNGSSWSVSATYVTN